MIPRCFLVCLLAGAGLDLETARPSPNCTRQWLQCHQAALSVGTSQKVGREGAEVARAECNTAAGKAPEPLWPLPPLPCSDFRDWTPGGPLLASQDGIPPPLSSGPQTSSCWCCRWLFRSLVPVVWRREATGEGARLQPVVFPPAGRGLGKEGTKLITWLQTPDVGSGFNQTREHLSM